MKRSFSTRRGGLACVFATAALSVFANRAQAEKPPSDVARVVHYVCAAQDSSDAVSMRRLSEAFIASADYPPSLVAGSAGLTADSGGDRMTLKVREAVENLYKPPEERANALAVRMSPQTEDAIGRAANDFLSAIRPAGSMSDKELGIHVGFSGALPGDGDTANWLYLHAADVRMTCLPSKPDDYKPLTASVDVPRLGLVGKIDDVTSAGDDRKTASSALLGLTTVRSREDDRTVKTKTTNSFDGTLAIRLTPYASRRLYSYTSYTLSRQRSRPAPALEPGKRVNDNDINALETGFIFSTPLRPGIMLSGRAGYIWDYTKGSRRSLAAASLDLVFAGGDPKPYSPCAYDYPQKVFNLPVYARCSLSLDVASQHVDRVGRSDFKDDATFTNLGYTWGIHMAPLNGDDGFVGDIVYQNWPTLEGKAKAVQHWDGNLKYRWWTDSDIGLDFGVVWKHGRELKTFTFEDSLELQFGIVH